MRGKTLLVLTLIGLAGCQQPGELPPARVPVMAAAPAVTAAQAGGVKWMLLDFETPDVPVVWTPRTAATAPGARTQPASGGGARPASVPPFVLLQRTSVKPQHGQWSASVPVIGSGEVRLAPAKPLDMSGYDLLTVQVAQADAGARNGECVARLRITDSSGRMAEGDLYPVVDGWRGVPLDLRAAGRQGVDLSRIVSIGLELERVGGGALALAVKTDAWAAEANGRVYVGSSLGAAKSFFVESRGVSIHVGSVGQYEVVIGDRGDVSAAATWMRVFNGSPLQEMMGQAGTGLYLLDADVLAQVARNTTGDNQAGKVTGQWPAKDGRWAWPASLGGGPSTIHWEVVWTSSSAAILEGRQEAGGFDRTGVPVVTALWRLMIYAGGQVYVDVRWSQTGKVGVPETVKGPASWSLALGQKAGAGAGDANAERLLTEIYTAKVRQGWQTALPHAMQSGAAVGMIAPASAAKDNYWWAGDGGERRMFGAEIPSIHPDPATPNMSEATCMLLVNSPTGLAMAGAFGQYLEPVKIVMNQGEVDRTFPGNWDNDPYGFVKSYGFQVVRLANGRATFTIYPQERPIFYPPILFTVPAAEREALDVKHSRLLINIDGKLFTDPAVFPDGSFLLQVPYVLDRPVNVEARLVK